MGLNFDNLGSMVNISSGTQIAAGGTFSTPVIDLSPFEKNAIIMVSVNSAGTGTLSIVAQEGTAAVSAWSTIGTNQMFTTDGSATASTFANIVAGSPAVQIRALALDKTNQFVRFTLTGTDSSYRISVAAFLPKKYANAGVLS
jgi:hypothetical protein